MDAGSVQGVVVQMMVEVLRPWSSGAMAEGSLSRRYRTHTLGLVCWAYSISASARAVLSKMHQ